MKPGLSCRALFIVAAMMAVLALASPPAAAQQTLPTLLTVVAAASVAATAPYPATAAALAAPGQAFTARPVTNDPDGKWEVEFHVGGGFVHMPVSGSSKLPAAGPLIATEDGPDTSRAVPSFFFGDGALLYNQFVAASSESDVASRITPLDTALTTAVLTRATGATFGGRIGRTLSPRFGVEGSFDYGGGTLGFTSDALAKIHATANSWAAALVQPNTPPYCASCTGTSISSVATIQDHQGHTYLVTGALNVNVLSTGRWQPYVTAGMGLRGHTGHAPSAVLAGSLDYTFRGVTSNIADTVTVQTTVPSHSFVGLVGAGLKYSVTPGWGLRADLRDHITSNGAKTLLSAHAVVSGTPPGCSTYAGSTPTIQDCTPGVTGQVSTLSGAPVASFQSFSGSGVTHQVSLTGGVFYRF